MMEMGTLQTLHLAALLLLCSLPHISGKPWNTTCPLPSCACELRERLTDSSHYINAKTVDCSNQKLTAVPPGLPLDTEVLLLQVNNIASLGDSLSPLENLTELDLSQNDISDIDQNWFTGLKQLGKLQLQQNWISGVKSQDFLPLSNLRELHLDYNQITSLDDLAFMGLQALQQLNLNGNNLTSVGRGWLEEVPRLKILHVGDNPITMLEDGNFQPLYNLEHLILSGAGMVDLSPGVFHGLQNLRSLHLQNNRFMKMPSAAIQKVPSLQFLELDYNPIVKITSHQIIKLPQLVQLQLNHMPKLTIVDNGAFQNLPNLRRLELSHNPMLSYLHQDSFRGLPNLEILLLNNNALTALYEDIVHSLPSLKQVRLEGNPLRCDCLMRWVGINITDISYLDRKNLICNSPPEYHGMDLGSLIPDLMMRRCMPFIQPTFPSYLTVKQNAHLTLDCRAMGEPQPNIYWVLPNGDRFTSRNTSPRIKLTQEGTLEMSKVQVHDTGHYTCVAINDGYDGDSRTMLLNVSASPNTLFHLSASNITTHSIHLSWQSPYVQRVQAYLLQYTAMMMVGGVHVTYRALIPPEVQHYNLTNLVPSTNYKVCLTVADFHTHHQGTCITATTKQAMSPPSQVGLIIAMVMGGMVTVGLLLALVSYGMRKYRVRHYHRAEMHHYIHDITSIPLTDLYSPITTSLWGRDNSVDA
ncbi:leucine-rich repeat neuronal protein 1-like isoform X2 [Branchiostoma floridae x Branchiostoma belcheri]